MGGCQNYAPFLGTPNIRCRYYNKHPKRDHNFDNHLYRTYTVWAGGASGALRDHGGANMGNTGKQRDIHRKDYTMIS